MDSINSRFSEAEALRFFADGLPGKPESVMTKPMALQWDMGLAYSPAQLRQAQRSRGEFLRFCRIRWRYGAGS